MKTGQRSPWRCRSARPISSTRAWIHRGGKRTRPSRSPSCMRSPVCSVGLLPVVEVWMRENDLPAVHRGPSGRAARPAGLPAPIASAGPDPPAGTAGGRGRYRGAGPTHVETPRRIPPDDTRRVGGDQGGSGPVFPRGAPPARRPGRRRTEIDATPAAPRRWRQGRAPRRAPVRPRSGAGGGGGRGCAGSAGPGSWGPRGSPNRSARTGAGDPRATRARRGRSHGGRASSMAARPRRPEPRSRRSSTVSAWSSRVWPRTIQAAPQRRARRRRPARRMRRAGSSGDAPRAPAGAARAPAGRETAAPGTRARSRTQAASSREPSRSA